MVQYPILSDHILSTFTLFAKRSNLWSRAPPFLKESISLQPECSWWITERVSAIFLHQISATSLVVSADLARCSIPKQDRWTNWNPQYFLFEVSTIGVILILENTFPPLWELIKILWILSRMFFWKIPWLTKTTLPILVKPENLSRIMKKEPWRITPNVTHTPKSAKHVF